MTEFVMKQADSTEFDPLPEDAVLEAEVLGIEERQAPFKDERTGEPVVKVNFTFRVLDGEYQNRRSYGQTSTAFNTHPDCRLRAWVKSLLGVDDLPVGFRVNTDDLIGGVCRIVIGHRQRKNADGTTSPRDYVKDVLPFSSVQTAEDIF